jgi:hypothetical protein
MIYFADNNLFKRNFITFGILILTLFFSSPVTTQ